MRIGIVQRDGSEVSCFQTASVVLLRGSKSCLTPGPFGRLRLRPLLNVFWIIHYVGEGSQEVSLFSRALKVFYKTRSGLADKISRRATPQRFGGRHLGLLVKRRPLIVGLFEVLWDTQEGSRGTRRNFENC